MRQVQTNQTRRKRLRRSLVVVLVGISLLVLAIYGMYYSMHSVPAFYESALNVTLTDHAQAGREMEREVLQLHNNLREAGTWSRVFTDDQVNGWIAADLPEKFPALLPIGIRDPRIEFAAQEVHLACHYDSSKLSVVVHAMVKISLAEEPNTIAIRICKARAGLIPLPLKQLLDQVTEAARRANLSLRWTQIQGDPVALLAIGDSGESDHSPRYLIESLEIRTGELVVTGRTNLAGTQDDEIDTKPSVPPTAD